MQIGCSVFWELSEKTPSWIWISYSGSLERNSRYLPRAGDNIVMKKHRPSLADKRRMQPDRTYKDLKQKHKAKIADPLPTHATFAVLEPYKLLFHFPAAVWTAFATGFLRLGGGGNTLGSFLGAV